MDLKCESHNRISPSVEHNNIYIDKNDKIKDKISTLVGLIRNLQETQHSSISCTDDSEEEYHQMQMHPKSQNRSIIVHCDSRRVLDQICKALSEADIINLPLRGEVRCNQMMRYSSMD